MNDKFGVKLQPLLYIKHVEMHGLAILRFLRFTMMKREEFQGEIEMVSI